MGFAWATKIQDSLKSKRLVSWSLFLGIVIVALVLRIIGCDWGQTSTFQPDEGKLVGAVQYMTLNGTYLHSDWRYPGQVTSKLLAFLLNSSGKQFVFSSVDWYVFCRRFTALISSATVAVIFLIARKIRGTTFALLVSFLAAVNPIFIKYAKQVTGDSIVFFFAICVLWFSLKYLENMRGSLACMSIFAACATLEKWNGGLICFYLAFIVIFSCRKHIGRLCLHTIAALGVYCGTIFLLAPNILSDSDELLEGLRYSYIYNGEKIYPLLTEYIKQFLAYSGAAATLFLLLGIYASFRDYNRYHVLYVGVALCLVFQWLLMTREFGERWGLLFFSLFIFMLAEGIRFVWKKKGRLRWFATVGAVLVGACYGVETMYYEALACCGNDTRIISETFLGEQGATIDNTVSDYYTTFYPGGTRNEGVTTAENRFIDDQIYFVNTPHVHRPQIRYAVSQINTEGNGHDVMRKYGVRVAEFRSDKEGVDLFWSALGHGAWWKTDLDAMRSAFLDGKDILMGAVTGPSLEVYDISEFTYEE